MAYAINIRSDNDSSDSIRSLWKTCGALETSPSMEAMQYPPHFTLAIYDDIRLPDLFAGFESALDSLSRMTIRFESLGYFEAPDAIILWAAPILPKQLLATHARIHSMIDTSICRKNYRPGVWVPHCSLATSIGLNRKDEALTIAEQSIEPVEVTFDVADCASFMPVKVLREAPLDP